MIGSLEDGLSQTGKAVCESCVAIDGGGTGFVVVEDSSDACGQGCGDDKAVVVGGIGERVGVRR